MQRLSAKSLVAAAVAFGAVGLTSAAHARSDVTFSIGVNSPYSYGYVQSVPAPVYVDPQPVYVQPQSVYVQPGTGYYGRDYYGHDWRHDEWRREQLRREEWRRHHGWERNRWADADRDGVPNRFDRAPYNPYRR